MQLLITHKQFIDGYRDDKLIVNVPKQQHLNELTNPQTEEVKNLGNIFWSFWQIFVLRFLVTLSKKYFSHVLKNYTKYAIKAVLEDEALFREATLKKEIIINDVEGNEYVADCRTPLKKIDWR